MYVDYLGVQWCKCKGQVAVHMGASGNKLNTVAGKPYAPRAQLPRMTDTLLTPSSPLVEKYSESKTL